ncbi:MAG: glycosyltransferase family 4 protein [Anaerolineae bacterium]|nr:glycosyltransferase family 4 protein [Anaerolineae bacterium]
MKKIGIDVRLTYYRQGGIAEYMRQLSGALAALPSTCEFHLLHNFRSHETLVPQFKRGNIFTPCHHRFESLTLGMELLPRRFDLLHSPDFIPPRFGAKRYVITVHDLAFLLYANIQTADSLRYYAGQIQRAVRQADHIIAVSYTTKNDIVQLLDVPVEKITVIWEGIHPSFQVSNSSLLPAPYLLFVGTIEPRKNIPNLLRGYAILKSRQKSVPKLVLAGQQGWLSEASFAAIETLELQSEVIWLDSVPFEQLPALYNGATMLVYPSLYEGFGFPPLEAMACGTPVITSDRGALREIAGEAALYVDPEEPESIAEAMQRLLLDETLTQEMRIKGLEHVRQFTWEQTARQTLAVYEKVLT